MSTRDMQNTHISMAVESLEKTESSHFNDYVRDIKKIYSINNEVLLIQTPQFLFDSFNMDIVKKRGYYAYPPTGLQWIAKALQARGLTIRILDLNYLILKRVIEYNYDPANWMILLEEYLESNKPSIVGVSSINVNKNIFTPEYPLTAVLQYLWDRKKYIIIAGGAIATDEYEQYLSHNLCHFVIAGEGENKINYLFDNLYETYTTQPLQGIYYKYRNTIEQTKGDPDEVNPVGNIKDTYDMFPVADYNNVGSLNPYSRMVGQDKHFSVFQLNRGCVANCKFCGVTEFMGNGVRHFSVDDVLGEIQYLVEEKGIRHFDVLDDAFLAHRKIVTELLSGLVRLHDRYGITWSSNNGLIAASITPQLMELMNNSGCVGFRIGVESGNPEMLKRMKKPANKALLEKTGKLLNLYPAMFIGANYIIGIFGDESFAQMLETFRFSCALNLDWASWAVFQFTGGAKENSDNTNVTRRSNSDFVPTKGSVMREINNDGIISGPEIFELAGNLIPSPDEVKEIWFVFNLVGNYINNKHLRQGGMPEKLTSWIEAVKVAYPQNPYMSLFAALGRVLMGDNDRAEKHVGDARGIVGESEYWENRFTKFRLLGIMNDFPTEKNGVYDKIDDLRKDYSPWLE